VRRQLADSEADRAQQYVISKQQQDQVVAAAEKTQELKVQMSAVCVSYHLYVQAELRSQNQALHDTRSRLSETALLLDERSHELTLLQQQISALNIHQNALNSSLCSARNQLAEKQSELMRVSAQKDAQLEALASEDRCTKEILQKAQCGLQALEQVKSPLINLAIIYHF
jgi:hypothetical protein